MAKTKQHLSRRGFLKGATAGAAAGAAAIVAPAPAANAEPTASLRTSPVQAARALAETDPLPAEGGLTVSDPGSDFMVDVFKTLNFDYIAANPSSSFRGLQESFVTYGGNKSPEWLTCLHEESAVGMATGYFAVEGKPMAVVTFAPSGLQHAAMTLYGAFSCHAPVYMIVGNHLDADTRRPFVDWGFHAVTDATALVREFVKWDDTPASLQHFAESAVRAYKIAMTVPRGPVVLVVDADLQENRIPDRSTLHIPKLTLASSPAGDPAAVAEVAKMLVGAENPLIIIGDVAHNADGARLLVELAETIQAPVQGSGRGMPSRHHLSGSGRVGEADVILGLNVIDFFGALHRMQDQQTKTITSLVKPGTRAVGISAYDLYMRSNYQDINRYAELDLAIAADPQATLPSLIEACKKLITGDRRRIIEDRGKRLAAVHAQVLERARIEASYGWDASPITLPRLSAELWDLIRNKDWAAVGNRVSRLWNVDKFYRTIGSDIRGGGAGGDFPVAIGAALAHRKYGRLCVCIQNDGDLMYANGALWTAAHHRIPMLFLMHNNRAYHQETMHMQRMGNRRERGMGNAQIGTAIADPYIDLAGLARSLGAYAEGPISDPKDLRPALLRAVERVEKGEVALLDTVTQPR